jgi:hypothetical protein
MTQYCETRITGVLVKTMAFALVGMVTSIFTLSSFVLAGGLRAPTKKAEQSAVCREHSQIYPIPLPSEDQRSAELMRVRAQIRLDNSTYVDIQEFRQKAGSGEWKTNITITQEKTEQRIPLGELIRDGQDLRLFRTFSICIPHQEALIIGLTRGWFDAIQGFVIIRRVDGKIGAYGLPVVQQGKIVVNRADLNNVKMWSASPDDEGLCNACEKRYIVMECSYDLNGYKCKPEKKLYGPIAPNLVTKNIIEIRQ